MSYPAYQKIGAEVVYTPTNEVVTIQEPSEGGWLVLTEGGEEQFYAAYEELAFKEYEVEGVGTVIDPEGVLGGYRVRLPDGQVTWYAAQEEATEENAATDIAAIIANPPPTQTQAQIYAGHLALGYTDEGYTDITLKTTEHAQAKFSQMVTLINLAVTAGVMTGASEVSIWDASNVEHTITVEAFLGLMLRYGVHCKAVFDEYAP